MSENSANPAVVQANDAAPLSTLPEAVRASIAGWAADALADLPPAQVPLKLARIARFTPAKRRRLGAAVLLQAVESDSWFRAAVAERARADVPADPTERDGAPTVDSSTAGPSDLADTTDVADIAGAAAAAYLLRLPSEDRLMTLAGQASAAAGDSEVAGLRQEIRHLRRDLARVTAERDQARAMASSPAAAGDEVDKLRRRLREQGTRLRQAEDAAQLAGRTASDEMGSLRREVHRLTRAVTDAQERARLAAERADRAQESLGRLREQTGLHKATADRRLDLLLSTVEGAVGGLRREWDLAGGGSDPADVVAGRLPGARAPAETAAEPSRLNSWLSLPAVHLIVDGYNVSKTGFPELTLAQQRERLVRLLSALSARTSAEVTIVFDGAAVAVPAPPGRGIRVLFSPPGVIADDVIRDLVAAEPSGRVVVVVSSDREVADGVRRRGARTAGSDVLLALLA